MRKIKIIISSLFITLSVIVSAQKAQPLDNQINLLAGLSQLALDGYNIEGNIAYKRLIFDYSHGVSLNMDNEFLEDGADKVQGLSVHIPWTTGIGIGYRFNNWLNLRVEPKMHQFELYYNGEEQSQANLINSYTTFTLGLGLYGNFRPFKNKNNFLKGIMIAPNVRWWPKVSSSLDNNSFAYSNKSTEQIEVHNARQIGMGNTPFFLNMSIGYSYTF